MTDDYTARAKREAAAIIADNGMRRFSTDGRDYGAIVGTVAQAWLAGYRAALESLAERITDAT